MVDEISKKLRGLRAEYKFTFQDISSKLKKNGIDIHRETLRKYEKNPDRMPLKILTEWLSLYETNIIDFLCANKCQ